MKLPGQFFVKLKKFRELILVRPAANAHAVEKVGAKSGAPLEDARIARGGIQNRLPLRFEQRE